MVSTLLLLLAAWAVTVPAVLVAGRALGRWSAPRPARDVFAPQSEVSAVSADEPDNVVALVPRPQNRFAPADRRAA